MAAGPAAATGLPAPSPLSFFVGATESVGSVKMVMAARHRVRVRGIGRIEADGTLILDQIVDEEGKPRTERHWRIRQVRPGRYQGWLSDASGPVVAESTGNIITMRYPMKGGIRVSQVFTLAADGQSLTDHMQVRKYGFAVATIEETTRRSGER